ncbi:MAG: initiation control protein YabA [Halobacteria archaeon]|nr:initiation control protein YabA [Halobacteria archaeon]
MRINRTTIISLVLLVSVLTLPFTAVAQSGVSIDVEVNGDAVSDGEEVSVSSSPTVSVNVTSDTELRSVEIQTNGSSTMAGVEGTTYSVTQTPEITIGEKDFTVTVETNDGQTKTFTVTLVKEAENNQDLRQQLNNLEQQLQNYRERRQRLNQTLQNLSERNQQLRQENQRLRQRLNNTSNGGNGGGGSSIPGFNVVVAVVALAALVAVVAGARVRKRE